MTLIIVVGLVGFVARASFVRLTWHGLLGLHALLFETFRPRGYGEIPKMYGTRGPEAGESCSILRMFLQN